MVLSGGTRERTLLAQIRRLGVRSCDVGAVSYGLIPYTSRTTAQTLYMCVRGFRLDAPAGCPQDVYDAMWSCWQFRPEDRPAFRELYTRVFAMVAERLGSTAATTGSAANAQVSDLAAASANVDLSIYGNVRVTHTNGANTGRYTTFDAD
eukprot:TRINITY_DN33186_c0_g1_i1.p2 TRINITY_DN33186_c0_g1~~TRINITY_DN33186_c0_g1_i1.p2  ORF type:complete len:150 (+),score=30.55 TRINITY_DN33186_c0_g1_i1:220-669(+)